MTSIIKIPSVEFNDVLSAIMSGESNLPAMEMDIHITEETAEAMRQLTLFIEDETTRKYYNGKVMEWLRSNEQKVESPPPSYY